MVRCNGCEHEMQECYKWQQAGYDAGLDFDSEGKHVAVFVLDKKGKLLLF